jgi:hypothetical protein
MLTLTGTKFWLMNVERSGSPYDSASSRAQAPQAGDALKSISSGVFSLFALSSAASTSLVKFTAISDPLDFRTLN